MYGRLFVAAGAVGVARAAVRLAAEHTAARVVGGTPLAERQLVRAALADASALTDGAEALLVATAAMVEQRAPDAAIAAARAKLLASRAADLATDSAGRLLGAEGCVADHPVARLLAAARAYQVIEGPTEVLQDLIGASLVRARPDGATR
jgi:alkylation response protein AidB-like acyl-CoA dehydrogenase